MTIPRSRSRGSSRSNTLASLPTPTPTPHVRPESVTYRMTFSQFLKYISLAHTDCLKLMEEIDADEERYYLREAIRIRQSLQRRIGHSTQRSPTDLRRLSTISMTSNLFAEDDSEGHEKNKKLAPPNNLPKSRRLSPLGPVSPNSRAKKTPPVSQILSIPKLIGLKPLTKNSKDLIPQRRQALAALHRWSSSTSITDKIEVKADEEEEEEQRTPSPPYSLPKIIDGHTYTGISACRCILPLPSDCPDSDLVVLAGDFWTRQKQSMSGSSMRRMPPIAEERTAEEEEARAAWLRKRSDDTETIPPAVKCKAPSRPKPQRPVHDPYERFRYYFTSSPTPVRVYISYREPPKGQADKKQKTKDLTPRKR